MRNIDKSDNVCDDIAIDTSGIYPVIYLTSEVKITSGNGTIENPYYLSL